MNERGFIMFNRTDEAIELLRDPNAFALLALIAQRARWRTLLSREDLEIGEAMVGDWKSVWLLRDLWHFHFYGVTPLRLVTGRERIYFEHFWNDFAADKNRSLSEADRAGYTAAYSRPGRMRAGWAYFVSFMQAAKDFEQLSRTKLTMPVLAIGGEKANGDVLGQQAHAVASDAKVVILKNTGHWVIEENPKEATDALMNFL